jgi:hypothetical protein
VKTAGIVTEAGTVAAARLLLSETTLPPLAAGAVSVNVPLTELPPVTVVGLRRIEATVIGLIVSEAVCVTLPALAVIVDTDWVVTVLVVTAKVAEDCPPGIITELGTLAVVLEDVSVTVVPAWGAAPVSDTVPVTPLPPVTGLGVRVTDASEEGLIVNVADCEAPFSFAVTVAIAVKVTPEVAKEKVPVD